ncbi:FMN-binding protein [Lactobacillus sp.]|uniref:FMN-binding protein n=1 Tax=Lactobacillus sp. TaxID=1591 RepID=UPI003EF30354
MSHRKVITSIVAIGATVAIVIDGYLLFLKKDTNTESSTASSTTSSVSSSSASTSTSSSSSSSSGLTDGTYTGSSTSTEWGDVQVQITVKSDKITTIKVLSYPSDNEKSQSINEQALPIYKEEALKAQSADIQQVSGVSETYKGFTGSLQSAINKAQKTQSSSQGSDS